MRINTNLTAMNTYTQYTKNQNKIASAVSKLSSGSAINSAADNAAGLAISEKMRAQIRGLNKAQANAQDAISLVQTAEGALDSSTQILQRMRELAVQSSSDTNENTIDRAALQDEFSQLQSELNDISKNTTFNKKNLLDGSLSAVTKSVANQVLANSSLSVNIGNATAGDYSFSVSTKLKTAAVAGQQATSLGVVTNAASSYFSNAAYVGKDSAGTNLPAGNSAVLGANAAASALLNGNYTFSASYGADKTITVTATGDNNQTFTANIDQNTLAGLATAAGNTLGISMHFGSSSSDVQFDVALGLTSAIATQDSNFEQLAAQISNVAVSISGGVTAQEATYGVYANLTGSNSVELKTGMSSVTFDNGVKVNFAQLTTAQVDTANKATTAGDIVATGIAQAAASDEVSVTYSNFKASDDSTIQISTADTFAITSTTNPDGVTHKLAAVVNGETYNATLSAAQFASLGFSATDAIGTSHKLSGISFASTTTSNSFTLDLTTLITDDNSGGTLSATAMTNAGLSIGATAAGQINAAGHTYETTFGSTMTNAATSTKSTFGVSATANAGLTFQVGANEGDSMTINIEKMDANYLGVASASVATKDQAASAINAVDSAINQVSSQRATLGAVQNRLQYKIDNLNTSSTNLTSAESQIRDVDMAREMTEFTNANILSQAATAMLAQANSLPQNVLSLIGK